MISATRVLRNHYTRAPVMQEMYIYTSINQVHLYSRLLYDHARLNGSSIPPTPTQLTSTLEGWPLNHKLENMYTTSESMNFHKRRIGFTTGSLWLSTWAHCGCEEVPQESRGQNCRHPLILRDRQWWLYLCFNCIPTDGVVLTSSVAIVTPQIKSITTNQYSNMVYPWLWMLLSYQPIMEKTTFVSAQRSIA